MTKAKFQQTTVEATFIAAKSGMKNSIKHLNQNGIRPTSYMKAEIFCSANKLARRG